MQELTLPELPGRIADGTIAEWRVAEGESFAVGAVLVRIETETALVDLQAAAAGKLEKILAPAGTTITPGIAIARTDSVGDAAEPPAAIDDENNPPVQRETTMSEASKLPDNVTPVLMPQVGNDMEEGTIVKWTAGEGDTVEKGQIIFEVETDKATIEIEADASGRLARIVAPEGEIVPIKQPVAYLADNDADVDAYIKATASAAPAEAKEVSTKPSVVEETEKKGADVPSTAKPDSPAPQRRLAVDGTSTRTPSRVKASPAARRFAAERGVNVAAVAPGSGPGGRVLSTDVFSASVAPVGAVTPQVDPVTPQGAALGDEEIVTELPKMRRAIARNLTASKQTVPHFYMRITIDAEPMMGFYRAQKQQYKLSVNDVIVKAVAATLSEVPAFRSRFEDTQITERPRANVGIAVGTEGGLRVPVVMSADRLSLQEVAAESRRVVENARAGKLENVGEGVFTISNLGMFGIEEFSAIINPPEAGILAVGAVREDVIVSGGAIKPTRVCTMTLSCDHRVVDGLVAAQFAARLNDLLENPTLLMQ